MNYIFLDVDGVLNNSRTKAVSPNGYVGIGSGLVKKLARIVKVKNTEIILCSTWKNAEDEDFKYLARKLMQAKIWMSGKTKDPNGNSWRRGAGIKDYIAAHPCDRFVILDDEPFDYEEEGLMEHVVLTNPIEGLTEADVSKAIGILMGV